MKMQLELNFAEVTELYQVTAEVINFDNCSRDLTALFALRTKLGNALAVHAMQSPFSPSLCSQVGEGESSTFDFANVMDMPLRFCRNCDVSIQFQSPDDGVHCRECFKAL